MVGLSMKIKLSATILANPLQRVQLPWPLPVIPETIAPIVHATAHSQIPLYDYWIQPGQNTRHVKPWPCIPKSAFPTCFLISDPVRERQPRALATSVQVNILYLQSP